MRAVVATLLTAILVASAWAPHVHSRAHGDHECPACLARTVEAARDETPDLAPTWVRLSTAVEEPTLSIPAGAPLGAVPGQSPPASE